MRVEEISPSHREIEPVDGAVRADRLFERFMLIANGPALFNALVAAVELGVFEFLASNPGATFEDIRRDVGLQPHKLRVLLLALCATEVVDRRDGRYVNTTVANEYLATDGPDSWRHILVGWQRVYYPAFAHTTAGLRSGTNEAALADFAGTEDSLYERLAHDPELERVFHAAMSAFTLRSMSGLIDNPELSTVRHLLDVGGGAGTTAARFAERYPGAHVTIFDLPSVAQRARNAIPEELAGRIDVRGGDIFADELPAGADAVLFSHALEVFAEERIVRLIAKAFDALPPGGKILVYGYNAADGERGGVIASRLSLYLNVLASGEGMAYPAEDYEKWLRQAGFVGVRSYTGLPYEHGLHVGVKS